MCLASIAMDSPGTQVYSQFSAISLVDHNSFDDLRVASLSLSLSLKWNSLSLSLSFSQNIAIESTSFKFQHPSKTEGLFLDRVPLESV